MSHVNAELAAEGRVAGLEIVDPGNAGTILFNKAINYVPLTIGAGAETRTLPAPDFVGQECTLFVRAGGGGTCTVTLTGGGVTTAGVALPNVALATAGAVALFRGIEVAVGTFKWCRVTA